MLRKRLRRPLRRLAALPAGEGAVAHSLAVAMRRLAHRLAIVRHLAHLVVEDEALEPCSQYCPDIFITARLVLKFLLKLLLNTDITASWPRLLLNSVITARLVVSFARTVSRTLSRSVSTKASVSLGRTASWPRLVLKRVLKLLLNIDITDNWQRLALNSVITARLVAMTPA